jgi:PASTA domain
VEFPLPPAPPPTRGNRKRVIGWSIAGIAIVSALAVLGAIVGGQEESTSSAPAAAPASESPSPSPSPSPSAETVTVPDLVGTSADSLPNEDEIGAFFIGTRTEISSETPGTILSQNPPAGELVPEGYTLYVTVAAPNPKIPDVTGVDRYRAARILEQAGFRARETPTGIRTTDPKTWQKVYEQRPEGGTRADPGTLVILNVAFPPPGTFVRVEGSGSALVTWGGLGSTHQVTVTLPWEQRVTGDDDIVTVVAQRSSGGSGSITCIIIREGRTVKHATSSGPYAVCSATD